MTESDWDFEHQRAETELTIIELQAEAGLDAADRITLDFEFLPDEAESDRAALVKALASFGYLASATEDGRVEASKIDIPFSLEEIWAHEERTTKIALARGFRPNGWGFWEP